MLVAALATRGLRPEDVATVVLTHLHPDHVSAVPQLGAVELYVHAAELGDALRPPSARLARSGRGP